MRPFHHEGQAHVDGDQLTLVCNFRAIDAIESVTGEKMNEILPQLVDPPYALLGKVLWGLLREKHEGVTLDEAAGVAFSPEAPKALLVMGDVLRRAFNLDGDEEAKAKNPRKRRGALKPS